MFDTLILENVKCPWCKFKGRLSAQTKQLACFMDTFKIGDDLRKHSGDPNMCGVKEKDGAIGDAYAECPECKNSMTIICVIENFHLGKVLVAVKYSPYEC